MGVERCCSASATSRPDIKMARPTFGLTLRAGDPPTDKIVAAGVAAGLVRDGDTLAIAGGLGRSIGVLAALEERFLGVQPGPGEIGPHDLTLVYAGGVETGRTEGLN